MTTIASYPSKATPVATDKVIGTDSADGSTKNFALSALPYAATPTRVTNTWSPGTIANLAGATTTVSLAGAVLGTTVLCSWSAALPAGVVLTAAVSAANTVTLTIINLSGTSQTIATGTATVSQY